MKGRKGRLTYSKVAEWGMNGWRRRNKCMAFDRSMTGSDWLDWEMSL